MEGNFIEAAGTALANPYLRFGLGAAVGAGIAGGRRFLEHRKAKNDGNVDEYQRRLGEDLDRNLVGRILKGALGLFAGALLKEPTFGGFVAGSQFTQLVADYISFEKATNPAFVDE